MKKLIYLILAITTQLSAGPALYEGFDMAENRVSRLDSGTNLAGETSAGWHSVWHLQDGKARTTPDDLEFASLTSSKGLLAQQGRTVSMRQMQKTFTGDVYGSFRIRVSKLKKNSIIGLLFGLPNVEKVNPKTSLISFLATRWGSPYGAIGIGGNVVKIEEGEGLQPGSIYLVLWKIENLPEPGERSDQVIQMWVLSEKQTAHFSRNGMKEDALNQAGLGTGAEEVTQYMRVAPRDSKLTLAKGMVISCFSYQIKKAEFDEIRITQKSLAHAAGVRESASAAAVGRTQTKEDAPNILFITMDDMNWDSINSYGSEVPNISPHIDSLAENGMRFERAYIQTAACVPSRTTLQAGRYPHTTGVLSFYNVDVDFKSLPEILRANGYYTGVINKPRDSSLTDKYSKYWDHHIIMKGADKRGAPNYAKNMNQFLEKAALQKQPFYCVVNIADPHKPFFNDDRSKEKGFDKYEPSTLYSKEDVKIPPFLPDNDMIHQEMANYYNSVKRGDDCVGAVLDVIRAKGLEEDTVIMFISDHGMPLPFAKSSVYENGVRTPWIVQWPGVAEPGRVDRENMISAVDFMPTVLDLAGIETPEGVQGQSHLPAIKGEPFEDEDAVFVEFNDNAGSRTYPMRAIHTKKFNYVFNAWGTGDHEFISAATWHKSENIMKRMSKSDPEVAKRYDFLRHRTVEELYDLENDPHALNNLIDDPEYQEVADKLRSRLENWMEETDDYVLEAFRVRDDKEKLNAFMERRDKMALDRAKTLQWKRYKNRAGGTGNNTELYKPE